jgi:gluconolactonase
MLFDPPKPIETRVFATYPKQWHNAHDDNDWVKTQPPGAHHTSLLEGPVFDRDGNFWCVDIPNGRILRVSKSGEFSIATEYDGWPNGLKFHRDGRLFIADAKHGIMVMDPVNGRVEPYLVRANLERFKALNDLFFASNGDLYFTDQGLTGLHDPVGRLFRLRPDGRLDCLVDTIPSPNGLVANLDETIMFVAVTRANAIWRVPLLKDGTTAKVGNFIQLSGGGGPDGLALDSKGRLVIAHVGLGSVWVFDHLGVPVYRIKSCAGTHTTNMAFGGPNGTTLFIMEAGSAQVLTAELDVAGKPTFGQA